MNQSQQGLSLIETLAVTVIVLSIAGLSLPGFRAIVDRTRVCTAAADFRVGLALSRNEAIRRRQRVDLLPLHPGDWRSGWQVVIDANNNQIADAGDSVLHTWRPVPPSVEVSARLSDARRAYVAFDPSGRPRTAASPNTPQFGSVIFQAGEQRRKLVIGFLGRTRICDPDRAGAAC